MFASLRVGGQRGRGEEVARPRCMALHARTNTAVIHECTLRRSHLMITCLVHAATVVAQPAHTVTVWYEIGL